ncbi:MAG: cytochrome c biogenesis protein ResB [Thiotrichales bacterium]|nr:MAG: cytochrome c biogenesis protein ResB [Thiotrichales bacterium]
MHESAINLLRPLASLKLTLLGIVALLLGVLLAYFNQQHSSLYIVPPLATLALNLLAAIVFNPRIRQNSGLLMFHICLLMIAILTVLSQLTSMKGRVEVTQGSAFDASSITVTQQGTWHRFSRLAQVEFVQRDIEVDYLQGLRRGQTRSQVEYQGREITVGDNVPLKGSGYRFYTTSNKGYAAVVNWYTKDGRAERGAIHFPSYPLYDWKQTNQWQAPSGEALAFSLTVDTALDKNRDWMLRRSDSAYIEITLPDNRVHMLRPGDRIELKNGVLEFEALRMWMGYKVFYDPFLAWFFAVALVGVAGIGWHYYLKLASPVKQRAPRKEQTGRGRAVTSLQS